MTSHLKAMLQVFRELVPVVTSGTFLIILTSCAVFGGVDYFRLAPGSLSVGSGVFLQGQVHRVLTYPFYHRSLGQLLLGICTMLFLGGGLENGVGTVRFLLACVLMSVVTGLLYAFLDVLRDGQAPTEGLVPTALACVALTTARTKTTKGFLCGVSVPAVVLPWVLVLITGVLVPHAVLPCSIVANLVGWTHGRGWFSLVDISESGAALVEKSAPFRLLRGVGVVLFVPASAEERRRTLLPQINPPPGSYPVQAYAPVSSATTLAAGSTDTMHEGWRNSPGAVVGPGHLPAGVLEESCEHSSHSHSHALLQL
ncbi:rhomboid domain-containing protein 2 [Nerophis lumbriciformis]|uniref:rhomboid domain-containing protein 2 n=1 Tax=Nerophis lumbriciformis TaxID=546530 RepID=UPI002AE045C3|nr:rhomboid domain-containing protein 2-like [Nerophis lumbriciformis]XP_061832931.1 rhomboid domain-containing protein 2-like [Nerophis lumbriciformis]